MNLDDIKKVYCSGIGGIGVSSVAQWFLAQGAEITGSDVANSQLLEYLEQKGVKIYREQKAENLAGEFDLFLYSDALPPDHPELLQAQKLGVETKTMAEMEGMLAEMHRTIAVTGTNGKSTTTAMLSLILEKSQIDPTVIIGTKTLEWKTNFRLGKSDTLVVEADEYKEHFLQIKPNVAVITNIEADHLDYYKTEENVIAAFQKFVNQIKPGGSLILNADDSNITKLKIPAGINVLSFGWGDNADFKITGVEIENGGQPAQFVTFAAEGNEYAFKLHVPGSMNVYNALGAIAAAKSAGVPLEESARHIQGFKGTWRRFEILKRSENKIVVTDYAHHPTAISGTIEAARQFYPDYDIMAVFQPHLHSRLEMLFDKFTACFDKADKIYLLPIYKVEGRTDQEDGLTLVKKLGDEIAGRLGPDRVEVNEEIPMPVSENRKVVWLYMSAGDLDTKVRQKVA